MAEQEQEKAGNAGQTQQQFATHRIYLKDLSFESPMSPKVFSSEWKPAMNVDLNTRSSLIDGDDYEVVLTITVTAKVEDETVFLIEVQQAGVFLVKGVAGDDRRRLLSTVCPNMLFPYAREAIDSVATRGTFPAPMLAPVNFDALFQQALQRAREQAQTPAEGSATGDATTH